MGVFQRYVKNDKNGNAVKDKKGKKIKTGPWFIQFPHTRDPQTGKVIYKAEKASYSKKKALKMFQAKCDAFEELEKFGTQIDTEMTFRELMAWGLDQEVMKIKVSAAEDRTRAVHLIKEFGNSKANQISPLMVDNFRIKMTYTDSERTKKPFSGTTINKMVSLARRIYYLGMDGGIVKSNPFARRGVFKEEPKGKYIPDEEFQEICEHLPDYLALVIKTAYYTGMRRGEILNLTWKQVDLFGGIIDLTSYDTKTNEPRHIFLNSVKELKEVMIKVAKQSTSDQELVFTAPDGLPVQNSQIQRGFKKACKEAEAYPYRLHDLRHTFNTNMLKAGVSQTIIMKLTGHKTNEMFLRYSHLDKELGEGAMKQLERFLSDDGTGNMPGETNDKKKRRR